MTRFIPTNDNTIQAVLLDDGWHPIKPGTFQLEAIEFTTPAGDRTIRHGVSNTDMAPIGFTFLDTKGDRYTGSMRAIIAIKEFAPKATQLPALEGDA